MPNPVPEKRVGLAFLIIGGFSFLLYVANSVATQSADLFAFVVILILLVLGWFLRQRYKGWGLPPRPPPKPGGGGGPKPLPGAKGGLPVPFGKKPAAGPPPGAKPAGPPGPSPAAAKPKGMLDIFKPKIKK
jgi:hypothetical protein